MSKQDYRLIQESCLSVILNHSFTVVFNNYVGELKRHDIHESRLSVTAPQPHDTHMYRNYYGNAWCTLHITWGQGPFGRPISRCAEPHFQVRKYLKDITALPPHRHTCHYYGTIIIVPIDPRTLHPSFVSILPLLS